MLVELNYILFGVLLTVYSALLFNKRRQKHLLYLTLSFTFVALSITLQILNSTWWIYIYQYRIPPRLLELGGLAFFAAFIITTLIALREMSTKLPTANIHKAAQ